MKLSELFTDETKWVKGMNAGLRREGGGVSRVYNYDDRANCFCLMGGANKIMDGRDARVVEQVRMKMRAAIEKLFPGKFKTPDGFIGIASFNDDRATTFADVQAVIREVESQP